MPARPDLTALAAEVAPDLPAVGSTVYFVGYPGGVGPARVDCRLDGPTVILTERHVYLPYRMTCPFLGNPEGASGALVYNERNEVVGVLTGGQKHKRDRSIIVFEPFTSKVIGQNLIPPRTYVREHDFKESNAVDVFTGETIEIKGEAQPDEGVTHVEISYLRQPRTIRANLRDAEIQGAVDYRH